MKRALARLAVVGVAASAFALPAAPASACSWTFVEDCVYDLLKSDADPVEAEICVIDEDTIGLEVCV